MFQKLINEAEQLLSKSKDKVHDIGHAKRVAKNARLIGEGLNYSNLEFLELCGWWHDVGRLVKGEGHEQISAEQLKSTILEYGYGGDIAQKAYEAVVFHAWSMTPQTLEGYIIRDADKLDFISTDRWNASLSAGQTKHLKDIKSKLPMLRAMFHFKESVDMYDEKVKEFDESGVSEKV